MRYERFVRVRSPLWRQFEEALARVEGPRPRLDHGQLEQTAFLYRQVLHDHALAAARFPGTSAARRVARLAQRGTHQLTRQPEGRRGGVWRFVTRTLPATYRRHLPLIGLSGALFAVVALFAFATALLRPHYAVVFLGPERLIELESGTLWTDSLMSTVPPAVATSGIATNNLSVVFQAWAGGALAGLGSLWTLVLNGLLLGAVFGVTLHYGLAGGLSEFVAAHGPLEITVIVVSAAGGLLLGRAVVAADDRPRAEALRSAGRDALVLLAGCAPWLLLLGVVESYISPSPALGGGAKALLGLALEVLFLTVVFNPFVDLAAVAAGGGRGEDDG